MRTIPCQEIIDVFSCVLKFHCQIEGYGKRSVAIYGAVANIPVRSDSHVRLTYLSHRIHQWQKALDLVAHLATVLSGAVIGKVDACAFLVAEFLIFARGCVASYALAVKDRRY